MGTFRWWSSLPTKYPTLPKERTDTCHFTLPPWFQILHECPPKGSQSPEKPFLRWPTSGESVLNFFRWECCDFFPVEVYWLWPSNWSVVAFLRWPSFGNSILTFFLLKCADLLMVTVFQKECSDLPVGRDVLTFFWWAYADLLPVEVYWPTPSSGGTALTFHHLWVLTPNLWHSLRQYTKRSLEEGQNTPTREGQGEYTTSGRSSIPESWH